MASHALVLLDYAVANGISDQIYLDASVKEQHVATAQVTDHQVESGSNVSDYVRPMPRKLTLEAMITNTPITPTPPPRLINPYAASNANGSTTDQQTGQQQQQTLILYGSGLPPVAVVKYSAMAFPTNFDRVKACYNSLVAAALAGAMFRITTTLTTYQDAAGNRNMAIVNLAVPRDADHGNAIQFTVDFQEVRVVDTTTVNIPLTVTKAKRGQKPTKPLNEATQQKKKTVLRATVQAAGG